MEMVHLLKQLPVFRALSEQERQQIADMAAIFHRYNEGEMVIRQGDTGTSFFILIKGFVYVAFASQFFLKLKAGAVFGEVAFISQTSRRISSVVCGIDGTIAMEVNQHTFDKFAPAVREKIRDIMLQVLVRKLDLMNQETFSYQKILSLLSASQVDHPSEVDDGWGCPQNYSQCRRSRKRFYFSIPVALRLESGESVTGEISNISTSGAFVTTVNPPAIRSNQKGDLLLLRHWELPEEDQLLFPCETVWISKGGFGLRWRFTEGQPPVD
ncbi:MAG: cyclic nucleotide-binding domain-containing protein [Magnetococcales bacterium]|nr:cyclic nucleotide-binding domain-containing protein [Magnetococcales bacterium]NGZ26612.1 cyclic nucleotide-binding domain-containing protein [Magnetococcales bacterium]